MKKFLFTIMILIVGKVVLSQTKNQLNVLQINIWQEGTSVPNGFPAIADEIIDKKADVVLFSEVRNYKETLLFNTPPISLASSYKGCCFFIGNLEINATSNVGALAIP